MATKRSPLNAFRPNEIVSFGAMRVIVALQVFLILVLWIESPFKVLPRPGDVFAALGKMWQEGLGQELLTSLQLNVEAIALTTVISIGLSYLTVMPFFRPIVNAASKGRFLSLTGFSLLFALAGAGGHSLKLCLLVFGMTVFFLTSMASVVAEIPKESFDHARTLRMSEWRTVWEVVILGTSDKAFEVLRQNAAIGWMMLTMVEGIVRSEGGIGTALLSQQKYLHLPEVFAIQLLILMVGILQDFGIGALRRLCCPYADIKLERKA
ncbi:MAG: nitrate ABC transporter permease [Fimbriimonadaceae bacterium]